MDSRHGVTFPPYVRFGVGYQPWEISDLLTFVFCTTINFMVKTFHQAYLISCSTGLSQASLRCGFYFFFLYYNDMWCLVHLAKTKPELVSSSWLVICEWSLLRCV